MEKSSLFEKRAIKECYGPIVQQIFKIWILFPHIIWVIWDSNFVSPIWNQNFWWAQLLSFYSPYLKCSVYTSLPYCWNWLLILLIAIYIPEYNKLCITKNCLTNFLFSFWMMNGDFVHLGHQSWGAIRTFWLAVSFQSFSDDKNSWQSIISYFFNRPNHNLLNESVPAMHPCPKRRIKISQIIIRVKV